MKAFEIIPVEELVKSGWGKRTGFNDCEVWGNKDKRIIYDPITEKVKATYSINDDDED